MSSRSKLATPVAPLEERTFLALLRLADGLSQECGQLIKTASLTGPQYNVLRILRGARPEGLACSGISDRMISHDPDMTRLLDRLEKRGLITRERQKDDRRVVRTHITEQGIQLLKPIDEPMRELHKKQFGRMSAKQLKSFFELLEEAHRGKSD
jgi:DNA-binding MarR family transcriptional regulator